MWSRSLVTIRGEHVEGEGRGVIDEVLGAAKLGEDRVDMEFKGARREGGRGFKGKMVMSKKEQNCHSVYSTL